LLLDLKMPKVDGLTVLRRARELDPAVTAIIITSYGTIQNAIDALRSGARGFLRKPFEADDLLQTVGEALEMRKREEEILLLRAQLPILETSQALVAEGSVESLTKRLLKVIVRQAGIEQTRIPPGTCSSPRQMSLQCASFCIRQSKRSECSSLMHTIFYILSVHSAA
jgi:DNA-binding NtrC family response regulator